jgi:hypothetical protein
MLRTLGKEREIDILATTHNPALIDAAGVRMLPFITLTHRDDVTGASRLTQLEDIRRFLSKNTSAHLSFRPSSVLRRQLHRTTMRLPSRLEDERKSCVIPCLLFRQSP